MLFPPTLAALNQAMAAQGAEVQGVKGSLTAAKCVITNCTTAVISAAANSASPAVATVSAVGAQGSQCPRVILLTSSCF